MDENYVILSEREAHRTDGSRTLTRTYSAPKGGPFGGDVTAEDQIPYEIRNDAPLLVLWDVFPDWTDALNPQFSSSWLESLQASHFWIISNVAVDCSDPNRDVWSITWITGGTPHWIRSSTVLTRPGTVRLTAPDYDDSEEAYCTLVYESTPYKTNEPTMTYVWFEMGGDTTTHPLASISTNSMAISGNVHYAEGDSDNLDKVLNNFIRAGDQTVNLADCDAKKVFFNGVATTKLGTITLSGDAVAANASGDTIALKITPVFAKQSNYIWRLEKTVIL